MIDTVLFDLDGTIVDTNELIIQSFLHVFQHHSLESVTREHIIPHMGKPLRDQFQYFSSKDNVDDMIAAYRVFNIEKHDELVKEFPYVREVIQALSAGGIRLGIVTTKMRKTTLMSLQLYGLYEFMDAIVTIDDVEHPKPHPEPVLKAVEALGSHPGNTLMVGDSQFDILSANEAGAVSVGVAWSLKGEQHLRGFNPAHIIHDMRDLLDIVGLGRDES
jgi:pyrophosphatase PpaX